jgi:hypothetical protein
MDSVALCARNSTANDQLVGVKYHFSTYTP